jgi:acetoin utilization deacetylase AcuC-like enzyme
MKYGIIVDQVFAGHRAPPGHPERPERIQSVLEAIEKWDQLPRLQRIAVSRASEEWIQAVHHESHFQRIRDTSGQFYQLDPDTYTSPESFEIALQAAGSLVSLTDLLLEEKIDSGFALVRPPGHHAESKRAMGFCLFNNVAVAAEWAIRSERVDRVAVVDFDVHHGNGTQEIFYSRPDVLYLSTHQYPFYPGTGHFRETGVHPGEGFTVNFPIQAGMGNYFYCALFSDFALPILRQFAPQLILVSAGYDAHREDPLAGMNLDARGFGQLVNLVNQVAQETCEGRILYVLEGGYNLKALARAVLTTITTTLEPQEFEIEEDQGEEYALYRVQMKQVLSPHWKV